MNIILASKSPRRKELLSLLASRLGFEFKIVTEEVDESVEEGTLPKDAVEILAKRKGNAVAQLPIAKGAMVISSDTLVELDEKALGKPVDKDDAVRMLRALSGRSHFVRTGISVSYRGKIFSGVASTEVCFHALSEEDISSYVESGEPMDKAGAYGIQGGAGKFVSEYKGDFDTVVGLSLVLTEKLMRDALGGESFD